jgi:hypothetical protein
VSFVYFAKPYGGGSLIKIGRSKHPLKRADQLHCNLLRVIPDDGDTEVEVHEMFAHLRTKGEWFRDEGELTQYITDCGTARVRGTREERVREVLRSARAVVQDPNHVDDRVDDLESALESLDQYDAINEIEAQVILRAQCG